ncbi:MAG: hypothetical protein H6816_14200 [Phycisphaerales bacterium]|nr:hypothetical protein [Phycisphaerales bacterium]
MLAALLAGWAVLVLSGCPSATPAESGRTGSDSTDTAADAVRPPTNSEACFWIGGAASCVPVPTPTPAPFDPTGPYAGQPSGGSGADDCCLPVGFGDGGTSSGPSDEEVAAALYHIDSDGDGESDGSEIDRGVDPRWTPALTATLTATQHREQHGS